MRDDARLQAAIDLLDAIAGSARPADGTASAFFRDRRYIGSKDRRAVSERVWGVLRAWARLAWWTREAAAETWMRGQRPEWDTIRPRARMLAYLVLVEGMGPQAVAALCSGEHHAPRALNEQEMTLLRFMKGKPLTHDAMPTWVRGEVPEWIAPRLEVLYGVALPALLVALTKEAPVDIRANTLKGSRDDVQALLAAEGIASTAGDWSPLALRLEGRANLGASEAFRQGFFDVQDEGSQLVALLADARPGLSVVDFCAGAGGKTLLMAAQMQNKGRIVACDVSQGRLDRSADRLKRAGAHNVTRRVLATESDKWVKRSKGSYDRVLVDAPCSGTGTWRRNPDAKWRLTTTDVNELATLQSSILRSAARLLKVGGRLTYATCSLLPEENEMRIDAFLAEHEGQYRLVHIPELWAEVVGDGIPCPVEGGTLRLDPAHHATDGFFVAVLERLPEANRAEAPAEPTAEGSAQAVDEENAPQD